MSCDCVLCEAGGCCSPRFTRPDQIVFTTRDGGSFLFNNRKNLVCSDARNPRRVSTNPFNPSFIHPDGEEWAGPLTNIVPGKVIEYCELLYVYIDTYNVRGQEKYVANEVCSTASLDVVEGELTDPAVLDFCFVGLQPSP